MRESHIICPRHKDGQVHRSLKGTTVQNDPWAATRLHMWYHM